VFDEQEDLFSRDSLGNLYHCRGEGITRYFDGVTIYLLFPVNRFRSPCVALFPPEMSSVKLTSQASQCTHAESSTKDETHNGPGLYGNAWTLWIDWPFDRASCFRERKPHDQLKGLIKLISL
jgi:hypothetical protein